MDLSSQMRKNQSIEPLTEESCVDTLAGEVLSQDGVVQPVPPSSRAGGGGFYAVIRSYTWTRYLQPLLRPHWLLLLLVALVLSHGITRGEPFFSNDETRHAMNGVFMRDLMVDMP